MQELLFRWPDFIITLTGVFFGAFLSYWISHKISKYQIKKEQENLRAYEIDLLKVKYERLMEEYKFNYYYVKEIHKLLKDISSPNSEIWELIVSISEGITRFWYDDIFRSNLDKYLPKHIQNDLILCYKWYENIKVYSKRDKNKFSFYLKTKNGTEISNTFEKYKSSTAGTLSALGERMKYLQEYSPE